MSLNWAKMTAEQALSRANTMLINYFTLNGQFNFDKAKELSEHERDYSSRNLALSSYHQVFGILALLSQAEKLYYDVSYMLPRTMLRKESPAKTYGVIHSKLEHMIAGVDTHSGPSSELVTFLVHLGYQLKCFVETRIKLISIYEEIYAGHSVDGCVDVEKDLQRWQHATHKVVDVFQHPHMEPMRTSYILEVEIVQNLLSARRFIAAGQLLESLLALQCVCNKLDKWFAIISPRETRSSFVFFSIKQDRYPHLLTWLRKFQQVLLDKFTLYFSKTFSAYVDMDNRYFRNVAQAGHFQNRLVTHAKKSGAIFAVIYFKASTRSAYTHPARVGNSEQQSGNSAVQVIQIFPVEGTTELWEKDWPEIQGCVKQLEKITEDTGFMENSCTVYVHAGSEKRCVRAHLDSVAILVVGYPPTAHVTSALIQDPIKELVREIRGVTILSQFHPGHK